MLLRATVQILDELTAIPVLSEAWSRVVWLDAIRDDAPSRRFGPAPYRSSSTVRPPTVTTSLVPSVPSLPVTASESTVTLP